VPEFVDGEVDVAEEGDVAEVVAEGVEDEEGEDRCKGEARVALYGAG
jgi:hypothetical protein